MYIYKKLVSFCQIVGYVSDYNRWQIYAKNAPTCQMSYKFHKFARNVGFWTMIGRGIPKNCKPCTEKKNFHDWR